MTSKRLDNVGEYGLLKRLEKKLVSRSLPKGRVIVGIGDDAFAAILSKNKVLVVTKDMLVEDIHFRRRWIKPEDLGYKSMVVNLSDLAAMGGAKPLYALVGLGLPGDISVDFVDKLYIGLNKACSKYGCMIAGGDTVSTKKDIVISITLIGEMDKDKLVTRSGARPGDLVCVSGNFGDSAAGLHLLEKGRIKADSCGKKLIQKHLLPVPRLELAKKLSETGHVTSMIDSSDGLAASLKFITEKSCVGAEIDIEKIPVSKELLELSFKDRVVNPLRLALGGGEDYELVFTANPKVINNIKRFAEDIACIGVITKKKGLNYMSNGRAVKFGTLGYQAFI